MGESTAEYILNTMGRIVTVIGAVLIFYYLPRTDERTEKMSRRLERVEECLYNYQNTPRFSQNTMGDPRIPEEGYFINGKRVYLSIDGLSVEEYMKRQKERIK